MANKIKAIGAYRPRLDQGNTVQKPELLRAVSRATSLVEGSVDMTIKETRDQIIDPLRPAGHLPQIHNSRFCWQRKLSYLDLGEAGRGRSLDIQYRADNALVNGLNTPGVFCGMILNRENIGKTSEELVTMWNNDHPEDPVGFSEN